MVVLPFKRAVWFLWLELKMKKHEASWSGGMLGAPPYRKSRSSLLEHRDAAIKVVIVIKVVAVFSEARRRVSGRGTFDPSLKPSGEAGVSRRGPAY